MSNKIEKQLSGLDGPQILQLAGNDTDATISVSGFVNAKVGNRVTRTVISSTIDDYEFFDGVVSLYVVRVTYNNSSHDEIDIVERTS